MNSVSPDSRSAELEPAKPAGMDALLWNEATAEQKLVLLRIAKQRARIKARAAAKAQTLALRRTATPHVDADAPLPERLLSFVRLHPLATAAAGGLLMVLGPGKLIRWGSAALPWILKLQQRTRG
ncbi:hypothetical protein SR914_21570 [Comamonas testosteroni]|jgi:hypothetical protein|uniref:Uncharacterized protein n=2 Tax=Comamonas testosteroni TaxID=285 RepID=B7WUT0_COMTK|nr:MULTISPECIES: hypothetical protein [Comamonas]AIJ46845.1 hypothetical protein O987_13645 [Comamonas testosteroni TK102]EED67593.1 conserved hypothetical protein [Comamonas testosteroni KF-1]MPS89581.1 hypothetical protein [Comamonas sp.]TYK69885.1 hypothetical protein FSY59_16315 [Comamonas sp. Z3]WQG65736.1 hypothetical protein SR914_21570 [Comamonas testosteroni]